MVNLRASQSSLQGTAELVVESWAKLYDLENTIEKQSLQVLSLMVLQAIENEREMTRVALQGEINRGRSTEIRKQRSQIQHKEEAAGRERWYNRVLSVLHLRS
tara:strand:- start:1353 stop:1661 length:309 start_codon:yes stop_codon:yes gene_type:complete